MNEFDRLFDEREHVWAQYCRACENKSPDRARLLRRFDELSRLLEVTPLCPTCAAGQLHN